MKKNNLSRLLFALASLLLVLLFFFPLWRITLTAPQYPDGITMYIWVNQVTGKTEGTLQNMNILNHYIGMKYIEPDSIAELTYFPYIIGVMAFLGLVIAYVNKKWMMLTWAIIMMILGALGIYDFYLWLYDYGHNLSPTAPIKVPGMVYQPPLLGSKMLLNFKADSYPHLGTLWLSLSVILGLIAFYIKHRTTKNEVSNS